MLSRNGHDQGRAKPEPNLAASLSLPAVAVQTSLVRATSRPRTGPDSKPPKERYALGASGDIFSALGITCLLAWLLVLLWAWRGPMIAPPPNHDTHGLRQPAVLELFRPRSYSVKTAVWGRRLAHICPTVRHGPILSEAKVGARWRAAAGLVPCASRVPSRRVICDHSGMIRRR